MLFTDLPPELISVCLSYLDGANLARVSQTCKLLRDISDIDHLWQRRCFEEYGFESLNGWPGTFKDVYRKVLYKYGCLLGLYRRTDWCYGGLIYIWYSTEGGSIVTSEYYGASDLTTALRSKQLFRISLTDDHVVCTEWLERLQGPIHCDITTKEAVNDTRFSAAIRWSDPQDLSNLPILQQEEEIWKGEAITQGVDIMFRAHKIREYRYRHRYCLDIEQIHVPRPCSLTDVRVPCAGLYKAMYSCHGVELLSVAVDQDQMKIFVTKISGDLNVPSGVVSVEVDLSSPVEVTDASELGDNELQRFSIPPNYHNDVDRKTIPKYCLARYNCQGTIANTMFRNPQKIDNHFVVFDDNSFGVLYVNALRGKKITFRSFFWTKMDLPPELIGACLLYVDGAHLARVSQTCKRLRNISDIDHLWQRRCYEEYGLELLKGWPSTYKDVYRKVLYKYGCLLGLYRRTDWCYGGLIYIWYSPEGGSIVASEYYGDSDLTTALRSKQLFRISLTDNHVVCTEWLERLQGPIHCEITTKESVTDARFSAAVRWSEPLHHDQSDSDLAILQEEEEIWNGEAITRGMDFERREHKLQEYRDKHRYCPDIEKIHVPRPCSLTDVRVPCPGIYKSIYKYHGVELLSVAVDQDKMKMSVTKISGDLTVPSGVVTVEVDLNSPVEVTDASELGDNELQPFSIPSYYRTEVDMETIPKYCLARYNCQGTIADPMYRNPEKIDNHFVVFDDNSFGVDWFELRTFSMFYRVTDHFQTH